jgi:hypothetical protein
MEEWRRELQV